MNLPHAVIIAGGRGERLGGVRKGDLRIGGRRLVDRVTESLGAIAAPLMVATGPGENRLRLPVGAIGIADLDAPMGGPLAGLVAAVEALQARGIGTGVLVSVAVDTPFLPADFVTVMREGLGNAPAAYAAWGDQFYPPNALWRIEALSALPRLVRSGEAARSLKALQQTLGAMAVDWTDRAGADPFANINTVGDLGRLGGMAAGRAPSPLIHTLGN
jgi:molybdopterin-guanine dinucleotide biosynthesis protein A